MGDRLSLDCRGPKTRTGDFASLFGRTDLRGLNDSILLFLSGLVLCLLNSGDIFLFLSGDLRLPSFLGDQLRDLESLDLLGDLLLFGDLLLWGDLLRKGVRLLLGERFFKGVLPILGDLLLSLEWPLIGDLSLWTELLLDGDLRLCGDLLLCEDLILRGDLDLDLLVRPLDTDTF